MIARAIKSKSEKAKVSLIQFEAKLVKIACKISVRAIRVWRYTNKYYMYDSIEITTFTDHWDRIHYLDIVF